jgi:uncharacterized protein YndB with AHSA1/START domain
MTGRELEIWVPADRAVVRFRRFVNAPPDLVFDAWTQPEHLRRWWGPRSYALVVCEVDLRIGGSYRLTQQAPDGQEHTFRGRYIELERPRSLCRTFVYDGAPEHEASETVTFQRRDSGTLVTSESLFASFAARDLYTRAGMENGMRDSHHRLDEWLETIQRQQDRSTNGQADRGSTRQPRW